MHTVFTPEKTTDPKYPHEAQSAGGPDIQIASLYGYLQTDTADDNPGDQQSVLRNMGVREDNIYQDIGSMDGRPAYDEMLPRLHRGDALIITSLAQIGNTYADIIDQWRMLTQNKHVRMVVLDVPLLDVRNIQSEEVGDYVSELTLQLLECADMCEWKNLQRCQREGIIAAKARGVRFGRPPKPIPPQFEEVLQKWRNREISSRKAAQTLNVAQETFLRWARRN